MKKVKHAHQQIDGNKILEYKSQLFSEILSKVHIHV